MVQSTSSTCWFLKEKVRFLCFLFFILMCHVLRNVTQSSFALFVVMLKILLQIWFRKICLLGTLAIALAKELLSLILQFISISDQFIVSYLYSKLRFGGGRGGRVRNFRKNTRLPILFFISSWIKFKKNFRTVGWGIENRRTREG